ncbi:MAG: hypothetical protein RLZZ196_1026 [Bacteroidota bacterium]|jgi:hypothetical protein
MELKVGTRIFWKSAVGNCRGIIRKIVLSPAASGSIVPWITIDRFITKDESVFSTISLCGTDEYLKIMKVTVG